MSKEKLWYSTDQTYGVAFRNDRTSFLFQRILDLNLYSQVEQEGLGILIRILGIGILGIDLSAAHTPSRPGLPFLNSSILLLCAPVVNPRDNRLTMPCSNGVVILKKFVAVACMLL